jgi:hypothetical protein
LLAARFQKKTQDVRYNERQQGMQPVFCPGRKQETSG